MKNVNKSERLFSQFVIPIRECRPKNNLHKIILGVFPL